MKPRTSILAVAALGALIFVIGIGYLASRLFEPRTSRLFEVASASVPGAESTEVELSSAASAQSARSAPERSEDATAAASVPDRPPVPRATGRVMDLEGRPIGGVAVALRSDPNSPIATSAADGTFDLTTVDVELTVADARWYTLRDTEPLPGPNGAEILVVVARAIQVRGGVQDKAGAPIGGALVQLELPWSVFAPFPVPLDRGREMRRVKTHSAADGLFEITIPSAARAQISAKKDEYAETEITAPLEARDDLVVTLEAQAQGSMRVEGVVVHADGTPGVGATVRYGQAQARVDDAGRFAMPIDPHYEAQPLVAIKHGFQAAVAPDFTELARSGKPIPFQRLVLGAPPLTIEGRVVDHEGRPQAGWIVQPVDPVLLFEGMIPPESAESVARESPLQATSAADGTFVLEGLQERPYRLQAHSAKELVRIESEPIQAGARNARLVVPANARFAKVDGIVEAADGTPIAGVEIRTALITFRTKSGYTMEHADAVLTDALGKFTLVNVPRRQGKIDAGGDAILPTSYDLEAHVEGQIARIVAARRCHVRVEGVPPESKVRFVQVEDARGKALSLMQFQSGGWASSTQVTIVAGGSPLFAVSEAARTIVFVDEEKVQTSRALVLVPGEITVVRW